MNASVSTVLDEAVAAAEETSRAAVPTDDDHLAEEILLLAALPKLDYELKRKGMAQALGVRVSVLDAMVRAARQASGEEDARQSQRDALVAIGAEAELWQDDTGATFATVEVLGHAESYAVRSEAYRRYLQREYGDRNPATLPDGSTRPSAPGSQAMTDALNQIDAMASRGAASPWFVRLGWHDGRVYLDLGNPSWNVIEIDAAGWRLLARSPVRFIRPGGLKPLPLPVRGDGLAKLDRLLGLEPVASRLVIGWLIGCFMPKGPFPVLAVSGEQGSGKTTVTRMLRRLVDPNTAETRTKPRDERDLLIAARNGWVVAFENISSMDQELSDAMCRVATGAAFGTRTLYTNADETLFAVCRPQIINAIPEIATAADLADRSLLIELPAREPTHIQFEAELWTEFEAAAPEILACLLDATATALTRMTLVTLFETPRMADFARWVEAAAPAFGWAPGEFLGAYLENRERGALIPLEADILGKLVRRLVEEEVCWTGEPTALLDRLKAIATDDERRERGFPKTAHHLSNRLRRLAPAFRRAGVAVRTDRTGHARTIDVERVAKSASLASSASSQPPSRVGNAAADPFRDANDADDADLRRVSRTLRADIRVGHWQEGEL